MRKKVNYSGKKEENIWFKRTEKIDKHLIQLSVLT